MRGQQCARVRVRSRASAAMDFFNVLTGPELLEVTEAHLPEHRERLYPPTVTLSMFLRQALAADPSCQRAVNGWAASRAAEGLSPQSVRTGGYCRARSRLPLSMVQALTLESGRLLSARASSGWRWRDRPVKLLDGTGISMPDTPSNQAAFPQPACQAEGVGFPLARLCTVHCLASGAVLAAAVGPFRGIGHSELDLSRTLLGALSPQDVLLADALYANYWFIADLLAAGVDVVLRQHGSRVTDFRRGQHLGPRDHVVLWEKPKHRPAWMSRERYQAYPPQLRLREAKVGGRILVTSLLEARETPKAVLGELYAKRWHVELDLRCIKTTLGMEVLRCRSPQMAEKELWVHLLGYNLIRLLMAQAAAEHATAPRALSFKHTVQLWSEFTARAVLQQADAATALQTLFRLIAQLPAGHRPGRCEPRARKRRPKSFAWLKVHRHVARARPAHLPNWQRAK
ncbi:MAG: IS4 family transposase [Steroidobacteraceae bacterium]|nr:IS4 family transposase [Nevskiaceae bacterium]